MLEGSRNVYMRLSPWENIRYFGALKGVPEARLKQQADELLPLFELEEKRNSTAQTLSRGMQQKLAIVVALLGEPQLLLLDEPTLGLDLHSSLAIQRLLRELCAARGLTIVVTTHQMDVAQALCRRVGIMRSGRVALSEEVDALVDLFRRQDYAARLPSAQWAAPVARLRRLGLHRAGRKSAAPGQRALPPRRAGRAVPADAAPRRAGRGADALRAGGADAAGSILSVTAGAQPQRRRAMSRWLCIARAEAAGDFRSRSAIR